MNRRRKGITRRRQRLSFISWMKRKAFRTVFLRRRTDAPSPGICTFPPLVRPWGSITAAFTTRPKTGGEPGSRHTCVPTSARKNARKTWKPTGNHIPSTVPCTLRNGRKGGKHAGHYSGTTETCDRPSSGVQGGWTMGRFGFCSRPRRKCHCCTGRNPCQTGPGV